MKTESNTILTYGLLPVVEKLKELESNFPVEITEPKETVASTRKSMRLTAAWTDFFCKRSEIPIPELQNSIPSQLESVVQASNTSDGGIYKLLITQGWKGEKTSDNKFISTLLTYRQYTQYFLSAYVLIQQIEQ